MDFFGLEHPQTREMCVGSVCGLLGHPPIVLAVEKRTGAVLGFVLGSPSQGLAPLLFEVLAKAAEAIGARPGTIQVRDRLAEEALQGACVEFRIKLVRVDALPGVEEALDSLLAAVGGRAPMH